MFTPWKGPWFHETRLLLLGESAYSWLTEDGMQHDPTEDHSIRLVEEMKAGLNGARFMKMISQGLSNNELPDADRLSFVWDRVAFTNYVPGTVGRYTDPKERPRPTPQQWKQATHEFRDLLDAIRPLRLVVLGLTMWEKMPKADYGDGKGAQAYRLSTGELCWCHPLPHPSGGLSWKQLAATIYFGVGDALCLEPALRV